MCDIIPNPANIDDKALEFLQHFIHGFSQMVEVVSRATDRKPLAKMSSHDSIQDFVDRCDASLSAACKKNTACQREQHHRQQAEGQCSQDDIVYILQFINVISEHEETSVAQA